MHIWYGCVCKHCIGHAQACVLPSLRLHLAEHDIMHVCCALIILLIHCAGLCVDKIHSVSGPVCAAMLLLVRCTCAVCVCVCSCCMPRPTLSSVLQLLGNRRNTFFSLILLFLFVGPGSVRLVRTLCCLHSLL